MESVGQKPVQLFPFRPDADLVDHVERHGHGQARLQSVEFLDFEKNREHFKLIQASLVECNTIQNSPVCPNSLNGENG